MFFMIIILTVGSTMEIVTKYYIVQIHINYINFLNDSHKLT